MHAGAHMAIGEPLNLLARLDEQTAAGDAHRHAPAVLQPHCQPREAGLAVDGQEVEVVVVPSIAAAECAIRPQISACMHVKAHDARSNLLLSGEAA